MGFSASWHVGMNPHKHAGTHWQVCADMLPNAQQGRFAPPGIFLVGLVQQTLLLSHHPARSQSLSELSRRDFTHR